MHYSAGPVPEHFQTIERAFLSHTKSMHFSPDGFLTTQKTHLTESQLFCSRPHSGGGQRAGGRVGGGGGGGGHNTGELSERHTYRTGEL